jgi:hypothetical protein
MMALHATTVREAQAPVAGLVAPSAGLDRDMLDHLRAVARSALLAPPLDLHRACALIPDAATARRDGGASLLVRALDIATSRPMTFHPAGAHELSFSEAWLLQLLRSLREGDAASALFLVGRMVLRPHRRAILFVAQLYAGAGAPVAQRRAC